MSARLRTFIRRIPKPSPALLVGLLALGVATTGTAVAAGTAVNIVDPTTSTNIAKVDSTGHLSTTVGGTVSTKEALPSTTYVLNVSVYNYDLTTSGYNYPVKPSTATVAIDHLTLAPYFSDDAPRLVQIYTFTMAAGTTSCTLSSGYSNLRAIGNYRFTGGTVVDDLTTPLILKPNGTRPWCLAVYSLAASGNGFYAYLTMTGWVVSGTAPTPAAAAAKPNAAQQTKR